MRAKLACLLLAATALSTVTHAQPAGPGAIEREGELTAQAPTASIPLELRAGQVVTLTASGEVDTVLTLLGPDGREVAQNDDVATGDLSSRIIYAPAQTGRYTAVVSGYGEGLGAFSFERRDGVDFGLSWEARTLNEQTVSLDGGRTERRFDLTLDSGDIFVASTFALDEALDTTLTLVDARGQTVAENDDRGDGSLNSQIVFQPPADGRYTLVAGSYGGTVGDMILSTAIDPNAYVAFDFATIARQPFQTEEGVITAEQPERPYRFQLNAGQTLLVVVDAADESLDPVLRLDGPDGQPVALNDDRGDGSLNSAIAYTAPTAGTYTIEVSGYGSSEGGYTLEAAHVEPSVVETLRTVFEGRVVLSGPEQVIETTDFRLRYTLQGNDGTTEAFAQLTADTLQRAYETQVRGMGWAPPIRDADGRYRAYVAEAGDAMGYAKPLEMLFDNPNTADVRERVVARGMLVIDNELDEGRTEAAEDLMHATVVHEFGHIVQYGYDAEEELNWLYESTASWIEVNTAGEDEDASRYSETDFAAPQLCWTTATEGHDYGQWTLLQSLADAHGDRIVVRLWENAATHDGLEVMSRTLEEVGTTIPVAIRNWRIQNFARAYALAPRMDWSVASTGRIKGVGAFGAEPIEQLGASYVEVRQPGARRYSITDGEGLELFGLGYRNGQVEVTPLGRGGVFDSSGYDYATLMVFNPALPPRPGDCSGQSYGIQVGSANGAAAAVQSRIDAPNFVAPVSPESEVEGEHDHDH